MTLALLCQFTAQHIVVQPALRYHITNSQSRYITPTRLKSAQYSILTPWCRVLLEQLTWFAASQEIPRISRNPKVHYRTHKLPPSVSILGQPNSVHIPTSHLLEIHPNIIHPSTTTSLQWFLSLRFPHQDPIHPLLLIHTRNMPSPSHSSRFYHSHNIG